MDKTRIAIGLAALLILTALSASPASAKSVSNNGHTSGPLQLKAGTSSFFSIESGGETQLSIRCSTLENGTWKIRKSEKPAQSEVLEGGHENFSQLWRLCVATIAGETKAATVNSTCETQAEQTGAGTWTGGVASTCSITSGACVITIAAGAPNTGLKAVSLVNIETKNTEVISNVTGFTAAPNEKCKNLGVTGTSGRFLATVIAHEQKVE